MKWTKRSKVQILHSHWFRWLVSSEPSLWRCRSPDRWSPCRFHSCDTNGRKILSVSAQDEEGKKRTADEKHSPVAVSAVLRGRLVRFGKEKRSPPVTRVLPWKSCRGQKYLKPLCFCCWDTFVNMKLVITWMMGNDLS